MSAPFIERLNLVRAKGVEDADEMKQQCLPDAKFELVHQVNNEKQEHVETEPLR